MKGLRSVNHNRSRHRFEIDLVRDPRRRWVFAGSLALMLSRRAPKAPPVE